jgi:hypothetical protein
MGRHAVYSGEEFNKQYAGKRFYKIISSTGRHGHTKFYCNGTYRLDRKINIRIRSVKSGITFIERGDADLIHTFLSPTNDARWIADVIIPNEEGTVVRVDHCRYRTNTARIKNIRAFDMSELFDSPADIVRAMCNGNSEFFSFAFRCINPSLHDELLRAYIKTGSLGKLNSDAAQYVSMEVIKESVKTHGTDLLMAITFHPESLTYQMCMDAVRAPTGFRRLMDVPVEFIDEALLFAWFTRARKDRLFELIVAGLKELRPKLKNKGVSFEQIDREVVLYSIK